MDMKNNLKTIIDAQQIEQRISVLAEEINESYRGKVLDIVYFVNSASMFCADLIRQLHIETRVHPMSFKSYPTGNRSGEVCITLDVSEPLQGCHVLVLEGIIVSGKTPRFILDVIQARQPETLAMAALGVKPKQLTASLPLKYIGFELGSEILTGYGIGAPSDKQTSALVTSVDA